MNLKSRLGATVVVAVAIFGRHGVSHGQESQFRQLEEVNAPAQAAESSSSSSESDKKHAAYAREEFLELGPQIPLVPKPAPQMVEATSTTEYLYNSNVLLTDGHRIEDALFMETFAATFTPPPVGKLSSVFYYRHYLVRYNTQTQLDFDGDVGGLSLGYPVENLFNLYGGFSAWRLYNRQSNGVFYEMYDTQVGLWRNQPLTKQVSLFGGYQMDWRPSNPSEFTRVDNSGFVGITYRPTERLALQLMYLFRAEEYLQVARRDLTHQMSFSVSYKFNDYWNVRAYVDYASNDSNVSGYDYDVLTSGGGIKLSVKF